MKPISLAVGLIAAVAAGPGSAQTQIDLRTQAKNVDFSSAAFSKPFRMGTALPSLPCLAGETFLKSNVSAGTLLYVCASSAWVPLSGVPDAAGNANKVLSNDGTAFSWRSLGGDVSGAPEAISVNAMRGRTVATTAPADGQLLKWSSVRNQWEPSTAPALFGDNFGQTFTSQTTVVITGATHGLGTPNLLVSCYDNATPARLVEPDSVLVHPTTFDVTIAFATAQSGRCAVNGSGSAYSVKINASNTFATGTVQTFQGALVAVGSDRTAPVKTGLLAARPGTCTVGDQYFATDATAGKNLYFCTAANSWTQMTGDASVASVFGRTGAVTAQTGDYSFSQISGTATNAQLAAGIDATKIGSGLVTNTVWGYLSSLTADVQGQLNNKAAASHTHTMAGDVTGTNTAATVAALQGRAITTAIPSDGQALVWSDAASAWQPGTVSGGGGGAGMGAQLGDFAATRTSATVLTIGANCSSTTPCNASFGNAVYSFTRSCTATITGGTGTAYVYVTGGGTLTIGHNLTVTASTGCLAQSSVTAFPTDSIPLHTWTAKSGTWDASGGRDFRSWLSLKTVLAGTGVTTVDSGGRTTIGVDTALVPTFLTSTAALTIPAIANGACAAEQTFTLAGALPGDGVAPRWPQAFTAGLIGMMRVSATDTIGVRVCNLSGASITPGSATYGAAIVRSF